TYPDDHMDYIPMTNIPDTDIYYYNTTLTDVGYYDYHIWAEDTRSNDVETVSETWGLPPNWDVNMDGHTHFFDLAAIAIQYDKWGTPGWIREDVDNDGHVHFFDLAAVAIYYGEYW
ncbi:unnamed protein product, partial [marine sediment metagenome]